MATTGTDETKQVLLRQQSMLINTQKAYKELVSASITILECYMEGVINSQEADEARETIDDLQQILEGQEEDPKTVALQACDERTRIKNIRHAYLNKMGGLVGNQRLPVHPDFQAAMNSLLPEG